MIIDKFQSKCNLQRTRGRFYCIDKSLLYDILVIEVGKYAKASKKKRAKAIYHIIGQQNRPRPLKKSINLEKYSKKHESLHSTRCLIKFITHEISLLFVFCVFFYNYYITKVEGFQYFFYKKKPCEIAVWAISQSAKKFRY